jgi:two-component system, OmpR family, response regulator
MANVVLVEDNVAIRRSLADFLAVSGHTVSEACSAAELYGLMERNQYEVAIVDINLPHHNGFSITRYLSDKALCAVIITTVRDAVEDRVLGYQSGADIYMVKPVEPEELAAAVTQLGVKWQSRRAVGAAPAQVWTLDIQARRLWAPNSRTVTLTQREARLIEAIASARDGFLDRCQLLTCLEETDSSEARSRIDTMLSRLRSKVLKATELTLPLATVHNAGVSFSGSVEMAR